MIITVVTLIIMNTITIILMTVIVIICVSSRRFCVMSFDEC